MSLAVIYLDGPEAGFSASGLESDKDTSDNKNFTGRSRMPVTVPPRMLSAYIFLSFPGKIRILHCSFDQVTCSSKTFIIFHK